MTDGPFTTSAASSVTGSTSQTKTCSRGKRQPPARPGSRPAPAERSLLVAGLLHHIRVVFLPQAAHGGTPPLAAGPLPPLPGSARLPAEAARPRPPPRQSPKRGEALERVERSATSPIAGDGEERRDGERRLLVYGDGSTPQGALQAAGGGSMRSEREPGLGLVRGGGGGREKRSMEVPLRRESPRREPDTTTNPPSSPAPPLPPAPVKQRDEKKTALSKVRGAGLRVAGRGVGARNRRARCGVRLRALWCCGTAARRGERYVPCCRIGKPAPRMSP